MCCRTIPANYTTLQCLQISGGIPRCQRDQRCEGGWRPCGGNRVIPRVLTPPKAGSPQGFLTGDVPETAQGFPHWHSALSSSSISSRVFLRPPTHSYAPVVLRPDSLPLGGGTVLVPELLPR